MEEGWTKRPSDCQLQEAQKKTDRGVTPAAEAICVPEHLALPGPLQVKQLHHLHAELSLGQSCHSPPPKKKVLCLCTQSHLGPIQLFVTL